MKVKYYPETDTLYVELKETPSVESEEIAEGIAEGIVIDYDGSGEIVGIEVEGISEKRTTTFHSIKREEERDEAASNRHFNCSIPYYTHSG